MEGERVSVGSVKGRKKEDRELEKEKEEIQETKKEIHDKF